MKGRRMQKGETDRGTKKKVEGYYYSEREGKKPDLVPEKGDPIIGQRRSAQRVKVGG